MNINFLAGLIGLCSDFDIFLEHDNVTLLQRIESIANGTLQESISGVNAGYVASCHRSLVQDVDLKSIVW